MIKDPPLLTIRRDFPRPSASVLQAFAGVPTGYVVDTMGGRGGLDYRIKPLVPQNTPLLGVAMTCDCGPADNLALFGAMATAEAGDILVAATDGFTATSVTGDLLLGMAKNRGILGLVTDGLVRDLVGVLGVGLPVYCAGITPNSPARNGPGTVGHPVTMGGMTIAPGDIVIGDNDGVVIISAGAGGDRARQIEGREDGRSRAGSQGQGRARGAGFVQAILDSDRVVEG